MQLFFVLFCNTNNYLYLLSVVKHFNNNKKKIKKIINKVSFVSHFFIFFLLCMYVKLFYYLLHVSCD